MTLRGLNAVDFSKLRLSGLGAEASAAQTQQIAWDALPGATKIFKNEAAFKTDIAKAYGAGYRLSQSSAGAMNAEQVVAAINAATGTTMGVESAVIPSWLANLQASGYYFVAPSKSASVSVSISASQQNPSAVIMDATTPGAKKKPTSVETFAAAMDMVKELAPLMVPQKQAVAANELLKQSKSGKQLYKKDTSVLPWIVLGVGVISVIGLGIYFATRKN